MFRHPPNDQAGNWQHLDLPKENPRYAAIAEILRKSRADRRVLDVGCGMGLLRGWLPADAVYTGIEPSAGAIQAARSRHASANLVHASAERFDARGEEYDSIVFNEMLYYVADPLWVLRKYASMLKDGGVMLCSIYQNPSRTLIKRWLRHWLGGRKPYSNAHCTKVIRTFMASEGWPIIEDRRVAVPGRASEWHIWLAKPSPCNEPARYGWFSRAEKFVFSQRPKPQLPARRLGPEVA